jgi:phage-related protein
MSLSTDASGNDLTYRLIEAALVRRNHHTRWQIACFRDASGRQPVIEYLYSLTNLDEMKLIIHVVQCLSRAGLGLVDTKMAKHIEGPIFELRKDRYRIMFARDMKTHRFVLLSTFYKKTYQTPLEEIEKAQAYWNEYLITGGCDIFRVPFDEY